MKKTRDPNQPKSEPAIVTPKAAHRRICNVLEHLQSDDEREAVMRSVAAVQQLSLSFVPKSVV